MKDLRTWRGKWELSGNKKQDKLKQRDSTVWLNFRIPVRESSEKNGKLTVLSLTVRVSKFGVYSQETWRYYRYVHLEHHIWLFLIIHNQGSSSSEYYFTAFKRNTQLPKTMFLTRVQYNLKQIVFKFTKKQVRDYVYIKFTLFYLSTPPLSLKCHLLRKAFPGHPIYNCNSPDISLFRHYLSP